MMKERTYRWPSDWFRVKQDFQVFFDFSITDLYDSVMSWVEGAFRIDPIRLDEVLHSKFGDYESRGLSMQEIIEKYYGQEATIFIETLL